jgi:hypothetical protein
MRVETTLIQHTLRLETTSNVFNLEAELQAWKKLFEVKLRDRTLIGVLIMFFQRLIFSYLLIYECSIDSLLEWSGINALLYYGPTLVRSIGMRGDTVPLLVAGGIGIVQLLAVLPAIIWIDKVGRRLLLRGE